MNSGTRPPRDAERSPSHSPASPSLGVDRGAVIAKAQSAAGQGDFADAAASLRKLLVADPRDAEAIFVLANVEAAAGNLSAAVALLDSIPIDHPEAGIASLGQSAQWCMQLERFDEAEQRYRKLLGIVPQAVPARRQLAQLLNRQGRRHEAAEQIRALCRLGDVRQDELHSLIVLSHAMYDDPDLQGSSSAGKPVYAPVGDSGIARKLFTDGEFLAAAEAIEQSLESGDAKPAIVALYGRAVAEAQDDSRFHWWLTKTNRATRDFADYWAALGIYLISQRRFEQATRALLEAAIRDPTDLNSFGRLVQTFATLGDEETSQRWFERWDLINSTVKANNRISQSDPPDPDAIAELAALLEQLDRPLEAVMWQSIESHYRGTLARQVEELNSRRQALVQEESGFAAAAHRLCGVDLERFPVPNLSVPGDVSPPGDLPTDAEPAVPPRFTNVAEIVGIEHAYQVAAAPQPNGFAIYQTYGGAVAVLDFDRDGRCDLFFAQGGADPPTFRGTLANELYRSQATASEGLADSDLPRLSECAAAAGVADDHYSMGATAGDWNQDGWVDLVVANLGEDQLLINNGDGTFSSRPLTDADTINRVPTSIAMGDFTGDHLPDLFELAYVDDPTMILLPRRNERGEVLNAMSPLQYDPGHDRIGVNDGRGGISIRPFTTEPDDVRAGLGLIVTDIFPDSPGNEIFVGNDLYADQLWVRDADSESWTDVAPAVGCAFGIRGSKTASMGIAAGDFDNTGTVDLHITNYQDRNASLLLNLGNAFIERNVQWGLAADSQAVLGFGSQAIDYDNDGDRDLVATNGHIEQSLSIEAAFEQPAQLFANLANRFELTPVDDPSGYWAANHLGRGLARLDYNRDGSEDFVVTHLGERSALLLNQTESQHHWVQFELVGVESERDAVGAKIEIDYGKRRASDWIVAGDGYFCRNEPVVSFGLGTVADVEKLVIDWPSGRRQAINNLAGNQRWLVVEGQEPFPR